jgi:hypothetical protein
LSIELTEEQRQAVQETKESPLRLIDPATKMACVLVRAEEFQRMQQLLNENDVRAMEPYWAELAPEDWEDLSAFDDVLMRKINHCLKVALELP